MMMLEKHNTVLESCWIIYKLCGKSGSSCRAERLGGGLNACDGCDYGSDLREEKLKIVQAYYLFAAREFAENSGEVWQDNSCKVYGI